MDTSLELTPALTAEERGELRELGRRVFNPSDPAARLVWAAFEDTLSVVRVRVHGELVSCAYVTQRSILVDDQPARVGGLRGVSTHPDYRRRGYARAAVEEATRFMWQELRPELGLLLSSEMAVPLYLSLGWQVFNGPVLCQQPGGTMDYTALMPGAPAMLLLPAGGRQTIQAIDLCGLPW